MKITKVIALYASNRMQKHSREIEEENARRLDYPSY
jgi:hypothetical protein